MNILFVLPEYLPHSGAGISTYYIHYIKALKKHVNSIKVLVGSGYTQSKECYDIEGVTIEYLNPETFEDYQSKFQQYDVLPEYRNNLAAAWAMWEQANRGKGFDLVECTDFGLGFIPWVVDHTLPVITRLHGSSGQLNIYEADPNQVLSDNFSQFSELLLLKKCDLLITHSIRNKNFWEGILNTKVEFVNPVFNQELKHSSSLKENYGVVCGRIQQWKGPDILCRAITHLNDPKLLIKWFGRDTYYDTRYTKSNQLKFCFPNVWGEQIIPQAPVEHKIMMEIQKKAKFAIIPSIWDVFNFTGLEYMACGTILICSEGAGMSNLITNGVNGFKYKDDSIIELSDCIKKVLALDAEQYNTMLNNAWNTLNIELNSDKLISINLDFYKKILNNEIIDDPNIFLNTLFKPSNKKPSTSAILSKIPIKKLKNHLIKRLKIKILAWRL